MGRESGVAADMYALGCILFLLLSGRLPFEGEDRLALGLRRAHEDAPSLSQTIPRVAPAVAILVDSLLAREPAGRPDALGAAAVLAQFSSIQVLPIDPASPDGGVLARTAVLPPAKPTVLLASAEPATVAAHPPSLLPPLPPPVQRQPRNRPSRRLVAAFVTAAATAAGVLLLVAELREQAPRVPNVVALRISLARTEVLRRLPNATVSMTHAYSKRIPAGRVISQTPPPRAPLRNDRLVRLVVSKGSPFADVPEIAIGEPAATAETTLARSGFDGRYRYTPSWTVRKGTVIELHPRTGTRLRRPATVRILVASGYPREVVPDLHNTDLASAQAELAAKHLNYRVVYQLRRTLPADQVLGQIPPAGATVYRGTRVRLAVSRTLRWVQVLTQTGADPHESDPFTVPEHWRIRYRLTPGEFGPALAQFSWSRDGNPFGDGGFFANTAGMRTYTVSDGAGTFRLAVSPYAGTAWYVEVDALQ
jgi:serine/threonine-protein kinase